LDPLKAGDWIFSRKNLDAVVDCGDFLFWSFEDMAGSDEEFDSFPGVFDPAMKNLPSSAAARYSPWSDFDSAAMGGSSA